MYTEMIEFSSSAPDAVQVLAQSQSLSAVGGAIRGASIRLDGSSSPSRWSRPGTTATTRPTSSPRTTTAPGSERRCRPSMVDGEWRVTVADAVDGLAYGRGGAGVEMQARGQPAGCRRRMPG